MSKFVRGEMFVRFFADIQKKVSSEIISLDTFDN